MCGIVGVISELPIDQNDVLSMRQEVVHRGPDDCGLVQTVCGTLGHTRLSILDPTDLGHQPMMTADGRFTLVYNGELYNDREIRKELESLGVVFRSRCDTETVLHALAQWGMDARNKLRGMYAFGLIDVKNRVCLLARDPMGVKPLYTAKVPGVVGAMVFGSEIRSVLAHPKIEARPDQVTMSAYLSTIRPEFGTRTLFEGVSSVEPGEWALYSTGDYSCLDRRSCWDDGVIGSGNASDTRSVIEDSVIRHLRTDVPMCALLSGGLDSSIIAKIAMEQLGGLRTFCAGAKQHGFDDDFSMAALVADHLGTEHTEVVIESDGFLNRWRGMVDSTGLPLSTPNEVAIYEVCASLRRAGYPVTLSGEGADELFGGYELPMQQAQAFVDSVKSSDSMAGLFHLRSNAWVNDELKPMVMHDGWRSAAGSDHELRAWYQSSFDALRGQSSDSMQAHLRFHRRMNLPNLLRRLDSSSMLSSVEGRTPFADRVVAGFAESLAMGDKFVHGEHVRTKIALRDAFADVLPRAIVDRPKASFPLPFQEWIGSVGGVLKRSEFARSFFQDEAVDAVLSDTGANWNLAWPMINLAMWGERWWGDGVIDEVFDSAGVETAL